MMPRPTARPTSARQFDVRADAGTNDDCVAIDASAACHGDVLYPAVAFEGDDPGPDENMHAHALNSLAE